jgi:hypothetical protein
MGRKQNDTITQKARQRLLDYLKYGYIDFLLYPRFLSFLQLGC